MIFGIYVLGIIKVPNLNNITLIKYKITISTDTFHVDDYRIAIDCCVGTYAAAFNCTL